MYSYRTKPTLIEAFQLNVMPPPMWFIEAMEDGRAQRRNEHSFDIVTLHGSVVAKSTDWIVKGTEGELYPVRKDVFAAKYEAI